MIASVWMTFACLDFYRFIIFIYHEFGGLWKTIEQDLRRREFEDSQA